MDHANIMRIGGASEKKAEVRTAVFNRRRRAWQNPRCVNALFAPFALERARVREGDPGEYAAVIDLVAGGEIERYVDGLLITGFRKSIGVSTFSLDIIPSHTVNAVATKLFSMAVDGRLASLLAHELPLAEAAHTLLARDSLFGKLVLRTSGRVGPVLPSRLL